jgi:predicted nucleic acid-binding protein
MFNESVSLSLTSSDVDIKSALEIALKFNIYAYDAYFLECAVSLRSPLITLDRGMKRVASNLGITILE